ncbi:MAG: FAD-binding protein, partial [Acidimicrobiia bacterium]
MDLSACRAAVMDAPAVLPFGARTQFEVGNPVEAAVEIAAPAGVVRYEPDDLTITVAGGTSSADLDRVLAEHGQECALDPRDPRATVGGLLAAGLSGVRRLGHGPIRDQVLEVQFVTADGRVVKGGGPTVKNVTGYDLPRLMVGSFGTLGLLVQVTLRCRPRAAHAQWFVTTDPPRDLFRPAAMLWDGHAVHVRLEGARADVDEQGAAMTPVPEPSLPTGPHRGRISIAPGALAPLAGDLRDLRGVR